MKSLFIIVFFTLLGTDLPAQVWQPVGAEFGGTIDVLYNDSLHQVLVAGGAFDSIGNSEVNGIARWDGTSWNGFGSGLSNGRVRALAIYKQQLYAGGTFTKSGNSDRKFFTRWNGNSWDSLEFTTNNCNVRAMTVYNGDLYVAGGFTAVGGKIVNNIARFNGTTWDSLQSGTNGIVYAMAVFNNELYVAGAFDSAGAIHAKYIAKWNGNSWDSVGNNRANGWIYTLAVFKNELYAGGLFTNMDGISYRIARLVSGTHWTNVGAGFTDNAVYTLNADGENLYAGGSFTASVMDTVLRIASVKNGIINEIGGGMNEYVQSIAFYKNVLYAGGGFTKAGNSTVTYIARYDTLIPASVPTLKTENLVTIYPNPASESTVIALPETFLHCSFFINDVSGKIILRQNNLQQQEITLSTKEWEKGVYFINFYKKNTPLATGKIIIE